MGFQRRDLSSGFRGKSYNILKIGATKKANTDLVRCNPQNEGGDFPPEISIKKQKIAFTKLDIFEGKGAWKEN